MSTPSIQRQYLMIVAIKQGIPIWHYRMLAEWLGCYSYVLPLERKLKILPHHVIRSPLCARRLSLLLDIIETTMLPEEQVVFSSFIGKNHCERIL